MQKADIKEGKLVAKKISVSAKNHIGSYMADEFGINPKSSKKDFDEAFNDAYQDSPASITEGTDKSKIKKALMKEFGIKGETTQELINQRNKLTNQLESKKAIQEIRKVNPLAIETKEQEQFVFNLVQ